MTFQDWLSQIKVEKKELTTFITQIEPLFTTSGFNSSEFERKINLGIAAISKEVDDSFKTEGHA
jgi:hypothetical protein